MIEEMGEEMFDQWVAFEMIESGKCKPAVHDLDSIVAANMRRLAEEKAGMPNGRF